MRNSALVVYTGKPVEEILNAGGTLSWVLDRKKTKQCTYAVLCYNPNAEWSKGTVEKDAAFMVGRISDVKQSPEVPDRWVVLFDEYAEVNLQNIWGGWRNPVKYSSLEDLGIDASTLNFKAMPERKVEPVNNALVVTEALTIEAAKAGLAQSFGVKPEAIEITIRG